MASRALMVVLAVVVTVSVASASVVYFQSGPGKAPGKTPAGGNNGTNGTGAISDTLATDGNNRMTMTVPLVGTAFVETDVKDHYTMPAGIMKVIVNISWDKSGWDLNLAIGTGDCPDNGVVKASQNNVNAGPVALEFKADGEALDDGQWFVHAACNDPNSHRGESVTFSYTVTTMCCG